MNLELIIDGQKKEYKVPENWGEVSLEVFEQIASVSLDGGNDMLESIKLLCSVTGMSMEDAYLLPIDELPQILEVLKFANNPVDEKEVESVIIEGEEYFLKKDFDKMTTGEVLSIDMISKKHEGKIEKGMSEMMCVFLRKKVDGKLEPFKAEFMERAELFRKNVMVSDIYQMFLFFSNGESK